MKIGSGVVVIGGVHEGKVTYWREYPDLVDTYHAGRLISVLAPMVGGKGGGKADMAQGVATTKCIRCCTGRCPEVLPTGEGFNRSVLRVRDLSMILPELADFGAIIALGTRALPHPGKKGLIRAPLKSGAWILMPLS
ncbi:MAG: hypothetical protein CM1200mP18_19210 [Gammaproteobacteria bacterium]|nr:MAG: hypothetical protein CM1200mP18_19210 [Gammaproteobacteria bacterium]